MKRSIFLLALLALPLPASRQRPQRSIPEERLQLPEDTRLALQEEFEQEQKDYNAEEDQRTAKRIDSVLEQIGKLQEKVATLQSKLDALYTLGYAGIWSVGLLTGLFYYINARKYNEAKEARAELHSRVKAVEDKTKDMD